jgi:DNA-binding NarL/FixJ family response regulator
MNPDSRGRPPIPQVLLVEDDERFARWVRRILGAGVTVLVQATAAGAVKVLESEEILSGAVVDLRLPDGTGWEVLEAARRRRPFARAIVLSGYLELGDVRQAAGLLAFVSSKVDCHEALVRFGRLCIIEDAFDDGAIREKAFKHAEKCALTMRETLLLVLAIRGLARKEMQKVCDVSESTLKHEIHQLLAKSVAPSGLASLSLGQLVSRLLDSSGAQQGGPTIPPS